MIDNQDNQPVDNGEVELTDSEMQMFGLGREEPAEQLTDDDDSEQGEQVEDDREGDEEEADQPDTSEQARRLRLKYNGEEKEITEEEAVVLAQKGMNYDKIQEKLQQQQEELERFRQSQQEKERIEYNELEQDLLNELEAAGYDAQKAKAYLDNHPAVKAGREYLERNEQSAAMEAQRQREEEEAQGWQELLTTYPDLTKDIQPDVRPNWLTPELEERVKRGYSPKDAYEILNRDKILAEERKRTEQTLLKNNRLNKRSQTERDAGGQYQKQLDKAELDAAALFGIDPKVMAKYK